MFYHELPIYNTFSAENRSPKLSKLKNPGLSIRWPGGSRGGPVALMYDERLDQARRSISGVAFKAWQVT